jgi:hypothetical protein
VTLILDTGALVALERNDAGMWRALRLELSSDEPPRTHGGVIAQVWRGGGGRQSRLALALDSVYVVGLDDLLGRQAGILLRATRKTDVINAAVVAMARSGDLIATSDVRDIERLISASGRDIATLPV